MERHHEHERALEILTAIGEGRPVTQRALAQRLGVALGLTNLYVRRLAKKGCIKVLEFPRKPAARKRLHYLLTPKGIAEKSRLTYEHATYAVKLFRRTRETLRESLAGLRDDGVKRIALYGTGEAAELAYLTLRELGIEPVGVYAQEPGGSFLGFPVRPAAELATDELDGVVVATFEPPQPLVAELRALGVPAETVITLRRTEPAKGR
ncbi:MAG TPA: winged helix-turn-helix transcriptional regulator [Methylomirabilota bacterium]|jgi:DNA-binding MarR family transcriptional regulator|nr:winged helix-turn-helix transcriptional regulator [Methylomirabilota bacterium]